MKLKLDENGNVAVQDGKPVYLADDGKEMAIDVPAMQARIGALNEEAKTHRLKAKEATERLAAFEGIEDPEEARKALGIVKNLDAKKLIDAGEAEKVKADIKAAYEAKLKEATDALSAKDRQVFDLMVGGNFARSKFVADKLTVPADMVQAMFGTRFRVEDGKVVAYDPNGNRLLSRANPGDVADFDDALEQIVTAYPHRDAILKGGKSGAGSGGGGGSAPSKQASQMTDAEKANFIKENGLPAFQALVETKG